MGCSRESQGEGKKHYYLVSLTQYWAKTETDSPPFPFSFSLPPTFLFFFFNKTSIFVPELSETAELVKSVNRTGPFYLLEIWKDPSASELAPMAGSSATVNGKAGKYIITSGLSLPEGFTVNYSIQGKQAGGKSRRGGGWDRWWRREGKKASFFFLRGWQEWWWYWVEEFILNVEPSTAFILKVIKTATSFHYPVGTYLAKHRLRHTLWLKLINSCAS